MKGRPTKEQVGERIRAMREAAGYSQLDLSAVLGIQQPQLCSWETGYKLPSAASWIAIEAACRPKRGNSRATAPKRGK